jgi:hypothetical protein
MPDLVLRTANLSPTANPISSINALAITTLPRLLTATSFEGAGFERTFSGCSWAENGQPTEKII